MNLPDNLSQRYRIDDGSKFRLKDFDPGDTNGLTSKEDAAKVLQRDIEELARLQELLWADNRRALLLIFQALDAAGKDSVIKHVMTGVNPQGCEVTAFKAPSEEELEHEYLWRPARGLPARGRIGIFNRSYYEEVLAVRVHPEFLKAERLPPSQDMKDIWRDRFQEISAFEEHLSKNGTTVRKFFLYVSKDEQRKRFLERIDQPNKNWKFSMSDVEERAHFGEYLKAYEDMIQHTSTKDCPWYVVPADHKWFTRLIVASAIVDTLRELDLSFPKISPEQKKELEQARKALLAGDGETAAPKPLE